ncbi:exosortase F system-associated protein [Marivirga sp. S37H4]|uniref:Exosortase F system-associated protein n=1 Tax=Marivirga aurantiaca TaxID=2802615 RepID=A0A935C6L8_9BACT|nr:exosortase F system-associated protein [Marivirga aurantiaca]MBK6264444.1 exosortase F system-associated protein [Marivirga aurantiaca]
MANKTLLQPDRPLRISLIILSMVCLGIIFIGQHFDYSSLLSAELNSNQRFIFNRTIRFLLNDNLMLLMIFAIFYDKKYVKFGFAVELFGFFFLLIPYFLLRFEFNINHTYISFIHRLIINPTLMLLLIPAIYIQRIKKV